MPDVMAQARAERRDLAELLESLTPEQWEHPTLCPDWNVRQVVAHMFSYEEIGWAGTIARELRAGFSTSRANALGVAAYSDRTPQQLIELVRAYETPRGLTSMLGGGIALTDGMIHTQDIRRPLGLPRTIPPDRLAPALGFALKAPTLPSRKRVRGVRLVATDNDWSHGDGPEVRGTGEALLLAIAGRPSVLDELTGAGVGRLVS